jgi:hypothetical protein
MFKGDTCTAEFPLMSIDQKREREGHTQFIPSACSGVSALQELLSL